MITQTSLRLYIRKMFIQSAATSDTGGSEEDFSFWAVRVADWINFFLMFSPDLKFPITFLSLMLYVFANQAAFSVLSNFTTTPGEFPLTKEPEDSGYEIWFRHVTSRFPFCLTSIFETKQIGKKFEIVVHPCHMNGNKDSRSEWH